MRFTADILRDLDAAGGTGLDMSPGDALCAEAAALIREQLKELDRLCSEDNQKPYTIRDTRFEIFPR